MKKYCWCVEHGKKCTEKCACKDCYNQYEDN